MAVDDGTMDVSTVSVVVGRLVDDADSRGAACRRRTASRHGLLPGAVISSVGDNRTMLEAVKRRIVVVGRLADDAGSSGVA